MRKSPHPIAVLNATLIKRIQEYADAHGLTYDEVASKAYVVINGHKIKPISIEDATFNYERKDEKA